MDLSGPSVLRWAGWCLNGLEGIKMGLGWFLMGWVCLNWSRCALNGPRARVMPKWA